MIIVSHFYVLKGFLFLTLPGFGILFWLLVIILFGRLLGYKVTAISCVLPSLSQVVVGLPSWAS